MIVTRRDISSEAVPTRLLGEYNLETGAGVYGSRRGIRTGHEVLTRFEIARSSLVSRNRATAICDPPQYTLGCVKRDHTLSKD